MIGDINSWDTVSLTAGLPRCLARQRGNDANKSWRKKTANTIWFGLEIRWNSKTNDKYIIILLQIICNTLHQIIIRIIYSVLELLLKTGIMSLQRKLLSIASMVSSVPQVVVANVLIIHDYNWSVYLRELQSHPYAWCTKLHVYDCNWIFKFIHSFYPEKIWYHTNHI